MTSTDALIHELSSNCTPVKRRSLGREMAAVIALGALEFALILMVAGMRPDMWQVILTPAFLWKIGSLAVLAGVTGTAAMRSYAPQTLPQAGLTPALALAGLSALAGVLVAPTADRDLSLIERLEPANGLLCTASIIVLAMPMMALLGVLMRRAAPVHPERSALATGFAAASCGALVFTACCPMNDPLYIIVWYSAGVALVTASARWLLPRRFRL